MQDGTQGDQVKLPGHAVQLGQRRRLPRRSIGPKVPVRLNTVHVIAKVHKPARVPPTARPDLKKARRHGREPGAHRPPKRGRINGLPPRAAWVNWHAPSGPTGAAHGWDHLPQQASPGHKPHGSVPQYPGAAPSFRRQRPRGSGRETPNPTTAASTAPPETGPASRQAPPTNGHPSAKKQNKPEWPPPDQSEIPGTGWPLPLPAAPPKEANRAPNGRGPAPEATQTMR
mmetsp:Transcript_28664/g.54083  ORF Transcript_28664/g.54083 Transcript_28664/m.54083 type:complete len:228 (-) Transcript_28664:8-691(-)